MLRLSVAALLFATFSSPAADSRWIRLRSANFEMYSSAGARGARDTIGEFEQVRGFFIQAFGGPPAKPVPVRLVAFGSAKEYEPYKLNEFATAYYQSTVDRDYIVMSHAGADLFPLAVHEYVHLLVRHFGLTLPPWLDEGMAELYSTLKPYAGKILVGDLIPGRHQALLRDRWVPLEVIVAAKRDSAYYNEKNKASSLYNEGWGLTHMLYFRAEYRVKFGELLRNLSEGKDSASVMLAVYGKTVAQIDKDLQTYLRGNSFQGMLLAAKLDKAPEELPVETLAEFDANLMLADLLYRPGKEAEHTAALERLVQQDPKRPEPYHGLGYVAWRAGHTPEAEEQFGRAFERGDRDPRVLWDYGRMLERDDPAQSIHVLSELLATDAARMDVRLELAETQLRTGDAEAALKTIEPIHSIPPSDSARFFRIAVQAHLRRGHPEDAEVTARHFADIARTDADRAAAESLVNLVAVSKPRLMAPRPASVPAADRPAAQNAEPPPAPPDSPPAKPKTLLIRTEGSASGRFVQLDCAGKQARMVLETAAGRKIYLIDNPTTVAITAGSNGTVDMTCGPQKARPTVEVGFEPARPDQKGIDGIVRTLAFR